MTINKIQDWQLGFQNGFNSQEFIATEGQKVFTLTNGSYAIGKNRLKVYVDYIIQTLNSSYTETSTTSFTLSDGLPAGSIVRAEWYESILPATGGHNQTHKVGGVDELKLSDLAGYSDVASQLNKIDDLSVKKAGYYDSVASMKQDSSLKENNLCTTIGYRSFGDYGGANYIIKNAGYATVDNMSVIQLDNGKIAVFMPNPEGIYPQQFGAYGYAKQDQTAPADSTPYFQALMDYLETNNLTAAPILLKGIYYVHELTAPNRKVPLFKGEQAMPTALIYNGSGGAGSHIIKYTQNVNAADALSSGGFENVSLVGNNFLNNNPIAEYGIIFSKPNGTTNQVTGLDWGFLLNNVHFIFFLKDGLNAVQSWTLNFTMNKVRIDACNEYGININLNEGQWINIHDFTVDYVPRNNPYYISTVQSINGAASKCGIGFLSITGDGQGLASISNARIEGNLWQRNHPSDNNLYANIYATLSQSGMGSIELKGITGGVHSSRNTYWIKFFNNDMGVNIHNSQGMYYQSTPIGYARNGATNSNVFDSGTRIGHVGSNFLYMPPVYNNGNRSLSLNGFGMHVEANIPSSLNNYQFYRRYDVVLQVKPNIYTDFETTRNNLGQICIYPNSGFGANKLILKKTISVTAGTNYISYVGLDGVFGRSEVPIPYLHMTIDYTDTTKQTFIVGDIDYVNKRFYLKDNNLGAETTISKTDSTAQIYVTVAQFRPIGYIAEIKNGTITFNGDGAMTSKTIPHGMSAVPTYWHVERASNDAGTAGIKYVTADATNLTVFFNTPPITGTNNVKLIWKAEIS